MYLKITLALSFLFAINSHAKFLTNAELVVRASEYESYRLPYTSFLQDVTPSVNDLGDLAFKVIYIDEEYYQGVYSIKNGQKGELIYTAPEGIANGDVHLNNRGYLTFNLLHSSSLEGVYLYDTNNYTVKRIIDGEKEGLVGATNPFIDDSNNVYLRSHNSSGIREIQKINDNQRTTFTSEGKGVSFLFAPAFSRNGKFLYKSRLGSTRQWQEDRPDILITDLGITSYDQDFRADSLFRTFRNTGAINNSGDYVFISQLTDGSEALFLRRSGELKARKLISTFSNDVKKFMYFSPVLSDSAEVLFRYIDHANKEAIGLIDKNGDYRTLVKSGDLADSDISTVAITSFHGNVAMNNHGKIAFIATIYDKNEVDYLGQALYTIDLN